MLGLEAPERAADGDAIHVEALGKGALGGQPQAGRQLAGEDGLAKDARARIRGGGGRGRGFRLTNWHDQLVQPKAHLVKAPHEKRRAPGLVDGREPYTNRVFRELRDRSQPDLCPSAGVDGSRPSAPRCSARSRSPSRLACGKKLQHLALAPADSSAAPFSVRARARSRASAHPDRSAFRRSRPPPHACPSPPI